MGSMPEAKKRTSSSSIVTKKSGSKPASSKPQKVRSPVSTFLQGEGHLEFDLSRSPKESPPTMKKKLCRLISGIVDADFTSVDGALDALVANGDGKGDGKSAHKWRIQRSSPSQGSPQSLRSQSPKNPIIDTSTGSATIRPSILKKGLPHGARRRVHFNHDVTVHLFADDGHVIDSCSQKLSREESAPKVRFRIGYTPFATKTSTEVCDSPPSPPNANNYYPDDVITDKLHVTHDTVDSSQVNFTFVEDPVRGTMLKFTIPLGREYRPEDVVVKANVSGSRVRLVANRRITCSDGSMRIEQLSRRYILPMDVDPYLVTARLDIRGNLSVEAPLLTMVRREALKRTDDNSGNAPHKSHHGF